jgi:hypothetical protein
MKLTVAFKLANTPVNKMVFHIYLLPPHYEPEDASTTFQQTNQPTTGLGYHTGVILTERKTEIMGQKMY